MRRIYIWILAIVLFLTFPSYIHASCEDEADNFIAGRDYKITSEYNKDTDTYAVTIYIADTTKHGMVFDGREALENSTTTTSGNSKTIVIKNLKSKEYKAIFVSTTSACKGKVLRTDTVEVSKPNKYAESSLCEGYEDFILCQKDYDKEIDEATFKSRLELYKQSKANEEPDDEPDDNKEDEENANKSKTFIDKIIDYIKANLFQVIVIAVFAIALIITVVISLTSAIRSRRLE